MTWPSGIFCCFILSSQKTSKWIVKHRDALGTDLAQTCTIVMWWLQLKICNYFHIGRLFSPHRDTCGNPYRAGTSVSIKCKLKAPGLVGPETPPFCTGQFWQSFARAKSIRVKRSNESKDQTTVTTSGNLPLELSLLEIKSALCELIRVFPFWTILSWYYARCLACVWNADKFCGAP